MPHVRAEIGGSMSHKYPCIYYDNGKCQKFSDDQYTAWCDFDQCEFITPSNADHIRSMTDEELAVTIMCPREISSTMIVCPYKTCRECALEWLKQPHKEDA